MLHSLRRAMTTLRVTIPGAAAWPWAAAGAQRAAAPPAPATSTTAWALALLAALLLLALLAGLAWRRTHRPPAHGDLPSAPPAAPQSPRQLDLPGEADELADLLTAAAPRLRQPLQALSFYAGSLSESAQPAQRSALHGMETSVRELAEVVNEIDHLLQWLAQPSGTDTGTAPLSGVLAAIRPELDALAVQYGVRLRWRRGEGGDHLVPQASTHLLRALVANAVRSAATRVLVTHRTSSENPGIRVHDDGPRFSGTTPIPLAQLLQQTWPSGQRTPGLSVAAVVAARTGARVQARSGSAGNLLEAMLPGAPTPAPLPQDTVLSLALLESEARNGRRTGSRLEDASPAQVIAPANASPPPAQGRRP